MSQGFAYVPSSLSTYNRELLSDRLLEVSKMDNGKVFYTNAGADSNEIASFITKEYKFESYITDNFNSDEDIIISGFSTTKNLKEIKNLNYSKFSGIYMTNSAFGLQLAVELLNSNISELDGHILPTTIKRIFIVNHASENDIGIIILKK